MKNELTAKRLADALAAKDMIPQDLANKTGIGKSSISQYLSGRNVPSNIYAGKIGEVLGVEPAWLMGFDVPREPVNTFMAKYNRLDDDDRRLVINMVDTMLDSDKYKKDASGKVG